jgi:hypothetical protein
MKSSTNPIGMTKATEMKLGWWAPIKLTFDELFDQIVEGGAYCELDFGRLFADDSFVSRVLCTNRI